MNRSSKIFRYVSRRLIQGIPIILAIVVLNFFLLNLAEGDAVDVLRKARRIDRKNPDVRKMLRRARAEVDAAEALDEAQDMVREKRYLEAIKLLGSVEEESASSAEARDELAAARELYVGEQLTAARKAMDEGAGDVARAALKAVLAVDPKNAEARLLDEQFAEGTAPAGEDKDEAKGVDAKPAARAPSRPRPERKPPPGKASAGDLLRSGEYRFGRLNFPSGDMVGHTGNLHATVEAMEVIDESMARLIETIDDLDGVLVFTADHGNADIMFEEKNGERQPKTSHTLSPVPFVIHDPNYDGEYRIDPPPAPGLANVAATVFHLLGYEKPDDYLPAVITF